MLYKWYVLKCFLVFFIIFCLSDFNEIKEKFEYSKSKGIGFLLQEFFGALFASIVAMAVVFFFVSGWKEEKAGYIYEQEWTRPIVSLVDNQGTYVTRHSASSNMIYNYAIQESLGKTVYTIKSGGGNVSIDDTLTDSKDSKLIAYKRVCKDPETKKNYWTSEVSEAKYVFKVPAGSFKDKFEVDMQ